MPAVHPADRAGRVFPGEAAVVEALGDRAGQQVGEGPGNRYRAGARAPPPCGTAKVL